MANYNSLKNAAIIAPTSTPDLGSATNRYGNVYMSGNINMSGTTVSSTNVITPKVSSIGYIGDDTAADIAGGQTITLNGTGFAAGATILINGTPVSLVTFVSSAQLTFTSPVMSAGGYVIYVINPDGGTALSIPGIQYSGVPAWTTGAGLLASIKQATSVNITVAATGDAPVTYSVSSGALPSGVTLNSSTGFISGTTPTVANTSTYNFTINATDAQKQDTSRNFSLTVTPSNPTPTVEYLVVAGGASGASVGSSGGGGGAGGYRTATGLSVTSGTPIAVTVGAGGTAQTGGGDGQNGVNSSFNGIVSTGGGGGGNPGLSGGSGGGGSHPGAARAGGTGIVGQGRNGGSSVVVGSNYPGGGGGGAGAVGANGQSTQSGAGGAGLSSSISGTSTFYAGGGGAGDSNGTTLAGAGGNGGGSAGGTYPGNATNATINTGGGGGGAGNPLSRVSGAGGSGIVILRYADTFDAATATLGSPTITVAGGYRVYKFTSSGSITF